MAISSALFAGVSGLNTLGSSMAVIGDNIANVNTIGFKAARATFETLIAQQINSASGTSQVGRGVAMSTVDAVWTQGSFETTNEPTDMAIGGDGFFMVRSEQTGMFYTRAGHFLFDEEGYLVNPAGMRVQGWNFEAGTSTIDPQGAISDIQINATSSAPNPTSEVHFAVNVDSRAEISNSAPSLESNDSTQSGFVLEDGSNDTFVINDGGGNVTIDLVSGALGSLEENTVYTGQQIAEALETLLNNDAVLDGQNNHTYTVDYNATNNDFTIANSAADGEADTIAAAGTINTLLGLSTTANTTIAALGGSATGNEVAYSITDLNNTLSITVDGNPSFLTPVTVVLDNGAYTIVELRKELEDKINSQLASVGESGTVSVRYDEANDVWQIASNSRTEDASIQVHPIQNNFLTTIDITEFEEQTQSSGQTVPGFTESKEANPSRFIQGQTMQIVFTEDADASAGAPNVVTATLANGDTPGTITTAFNTSAFYSGEELSAYWEATLNDAASAGYTFTVDYDSTTDRFSVQNNHATEDVQIQWQNTTLNTAAEILGFTQQDNLEASETGVSDSAVAFNVTSVNNTLNIVVNGNPITGNVPVDVTIDEGVYNGPSLAREIEDKINEALDTAGEEQTVNVQFNDSTNRFSIASSKLGGESTLQVNRAGIPDPTTTPSLVGGTLWMDDNTENVGLGFSVENPNTTSDYSTSLVHYDSLGSQHTVTYYFRKAVEGDTATTWEWFAYLPASETASGEAEVQARGTLAFNNEGVLTNEDMEWLTERQQTQPDGSVITVPGEGFDFGSGASPQQEVDINFGMETGTNVSTQYSAASSTIFQTQDGYGSGFLQDVSVDPDGVVSGNYSNGQILFLARVALANFTNPWGLSREGGNLFSETRSSGQPLTGTPGSAGMGQIAPNSLEQSNVDLSTEFVNMIIQQRGFQANSRIITTTDDMLGELINLKR